MNQRKGLILRVLDFSLEYAVWLSWILYVSGILLFLFGLPLFTKPVFFDEKALLAGKVLPQIQSAHAIRNAMISMKECAGLGNVDGNKTGVQLWATKKIEESGIEVIKQNVSPNGKLCSTVCQNHYSIVHTPRGDAKEAVVLVTPLDLHMHRANDSSKRDIQCMALSLGLELTNYLNSVNWLSKNFIWLIIDNNCGFSLSLNSWLEQYHGIGQKRNFKRAGVIGQAIVLDLKDTNINSLELSLEGYNGHLVKLELYWLVRSLAKRLQNLPVAFSKGIFHNLEFCATPRTKLQSMLCFLLKQSSGIASGFHGAFHRFSIEAITITPFKSAKFKAKDQRESFQSLVEILECMVRCFSSLIERINRSYYYYLLSDFDNFIPIEVYITPVVLLLLSMVLKVSKMKDQAVLQLTGKEVSFSISIVVLTYGFGMIFGLVLKVAAHLYFKSENILLDLIPQASPIQTLSAVISGSTLIFLLLIQTRSLIQDKNRIRTDKVRYLIWLLSFTSAIILLTIYACINWCLGYVGAIMVSTHCLITSPNARHTRSYISVPVMALFSPLFLLFNFSLLCVKASIWETIFCEMPLISFLFWSVFYLPFWMLTFALMIIIDVPLVQVLSLYLREPVLSSRRIIRVALFGGARHLVITIVSWFLWIVSVVFATPVVNPSLLEVKPAHVSVLHGAALAVSVLSLFLNIKALFVFDRPKISPKFKTYNPLKRFVAPEIGFVTVLVLGLILSVMSAVILAVTDTLPDVPSKLLYCSISVLCSLIAASTTHGLGGYLRHGKNSELENRWRFYQPFVGGRVFIATQALGWSLFSVSLVFFLAVVQQIMKGVAFAIRVWALASGGAMVITQVVLAVSLLTFRPGNTDRWIPYLKERVMENLPVLVMYTPVHSFCTLWVLTFTLCPALPTFIFWLALLPIYYYVSNRGNPKHTGCRKWPAFRKFFEQYIEKSLILWFGSVQVVNSFGTKLDPSKKYVYGYHPHGMYPCGAGFLCTLPQFKEKVCDKSPICLSASAVFFPPLMRDLLSWFGVREVNRETFIKALEEENSVLLCPGGQEELVESYRATMQTKLPQEIVFCSRHKGFCRLAIEQQAALVPVLSLGEIFTMHNAFNMPAFQKMTYKRIGFPIPYLLVGRWGFSPLPKKVPLMYVVGEPIHPPQINSGDPGYEDALNQFHQNFFKAMLELFEKYKNQHPFYQKTKAVLQ